LCGKYNIELTIVRVRSCFRMKKIIYTLLFIYACAFSCAMAANDAESSAKSKSVAQQMIETISVPNSLELGLNGKVKHYTLFNSTEYNDSTESEIFFVCRMSFDVEGNVIRTYSGEDTSSCAYCTYQYDEYGDLIQLCIYASNQMMKKKMICQYNENRGLSYLEIQEYDCYYTGKMTARYSSVFDRNGAEKRDEISFYDVDGNVKKREVYKYSGPDIVEVSLYDQKGKLVSKKPAKMSGNYDIVKNDISFFVLGKSHGFDRAEYDELGNMTERVRYYIDRKVKYSCQIEYY